MPTTWAAQSISNLLAIDAEYPSPEIVRRNAAQQDWTEECRRSLADPESFWGEYAKRFAWTRPWKKVLRWDGVNHEWFVGAKTNITINALDRPAQSERRNRAAYIWLGED